MDLTQSCVLVLTSRANDCFRWRSEPLGTTRAKMVSGERLIVLFQARFLQAVGFTSVCSTWCRGRGQSGAVISWYAAVRNEARARRMMLRGDDFWQFASNTGRLVEPDKKITTWYLVVNYIT